MAFDTTQLADYSWPDIQKAAKTAMLMAAVGGGELRMADGRSIGRITIEAATALYNFATEQINAESTDAAGGIALVLYGERV